MNVVLNLRHKINFIQINFYVVISLFFLLFSNCNPPNFGIKIEGKLLKYAPLKVYLIDIELEQSRLLDSTVIKSDKTFELFKRDFPSTHLLALLFNNQTELILINDVPRIKVIEDSSSRYGWTITHSNLSNEIQPLVYFFNRMDKKFADIKDSLIIQSPNFYKKNIIYQEAVAKLQLDLTKIIKQLKSGVIVYYCIGRTLPYLQPEILLNILNQNMVRLQYDPLLIKTAKYLTKIKSNIS